MRILFYESFASSLLVTLLSFLLLPETIAVHFGADGTADRWASSHVDALVMTGVHLMLFCLLYFAPALVTILPARLVNVPNKDYWLSPENRSRTREKIQRFMSLFGTGLFGLLLVMGVLTYLANLRTPAKLDLRVLFPCLLLFLVSNVWWLYLFYRSFRIPGGNAVSGDRSRMPL